MTGAELVRSINETLAKNGIGNNEFLKASGISSASKSLWNRGIVEPTRSSFYKVENAMKELGCYSDWTTISRRKKEDIKDDELEEKYNEIAKTIEIIQDNLYRLKQLVKEVY